MEAIGWCIRELLFESSNLMPIGVGEVLKIEWAGNTAY
jgi:hypothetical protein